VRRRHRATIACATVIFPATATSRESTDNANVYYELSVSPRWALDGTPPCGRPRSGSAAWPPSAAPRLLLEVKALTWRPRRAENAPQDRSRCLPGDEAHAFSVALASRVRRLPPPIRAGNPERFYEEQSQIAHDIAALAERVCRGPQKALPRVRRLFLHLAVLPRARPANGYPGSKSAKLSPSGPSAGLSCRR
jgi:hypothetical protein